MFFMTCTQSCDHKESVHEAGQHLLGRHDCPRVPRASHARHAFLYSTRCNLRRMISSVQTLQQQPQAGSSHTWSTVC
jgi:hypothetical protein